MSAHDDRFLRQLGPALELWVSEQLVSAEQAQRLRGYYALDELPRTAHGRFGSVMFGFGALLVGLGLITFVAANWDAITPAMRSICGLLLMLGLDLAGFHYLRKPKRHRLGSALLFMGAFALGGNIALMAQWFQIGGSGWGLFLGWSIGCFAMALGLRQGLIAALSVCCMLAVMAVLPDDGIHLEWLFPWLFMLVYLPVASWCDSRIAYYATLFAACGSITMLTAEMGPIGVTTGVAVCVLVIWAVAAWQEGRLPLEALPGFGSRLPNRSDLDGLRHARAPQTIALIAVLGLLQAWSFRDAWRGEAESFGHFSTLSSASLASFSLIALLAVGCWIWTLSRANDPTLHWVVGVTLAAIMLMLGFQRVGEGMLIPMNLVMLGFCLGLAWLGLARGDRRWFWLGLIGLTCQIIARFQEYDSDLGTKAAVFTIWGLVLLGIGWRFERTLEHPPAAGAATPVAEA